MRSVRVFLAAMPLAVLSACATQDPPPAEVPTYQEGYAKGCQWSSLYPGLVFGWDLDPERIDHDPAFRKGLRAGMDACGFVSEGPTMADYLPLPGMGHIALDDDDPERPVTEEDVDLVPGNEDTDPMAEEPPAVMDETILPAENARMPGGAAEPLPDGKRAGDSPG